MHTEKGECGIGHWINQMPDEVLPLRPDLIIFATERNNTHDSPLSGILGNTIGVQSCTVHHQRCFVIGFGRWNYPAVRGFAKRPRLSARDYAAAAVRDETDQRVS